MNETGESKTGVPGATRKTGRRPARLTMSTDHVLLQFEIDGTLIGTDGAGAASWRFAFEELYGTPTEIGKYTDAGMAHSQVA